MERKYRYVGSKTLLALLDQPVQRTHVRQPADVLNWIKETQQPLERDKTITATFIVDLEHRLWISYQRSEHVVCARGQDVLSAGEITFAVRNQQVEVVAITNQSTGYCPEPESWMAVEEALKPTGLPHPSSFTTEFLFRRCDKCGTTNIVKDNWFECAVCQSPLSTTWNYMRSGDSDE